MKFKSMTLLLAASFICLFLTGQTSKPAKNNTMLRAGFAKIDITPNLPVKLYGYSSRKAYSEGVHDQLYARAVVFDDGSNKVVFVSSDLGSYSGEAFPVISKSILEKYKLKESELFLTAIHSHSTPILSLNKDKGDPNNIEYTRTLNQKLLTLVGEAFTDLKPVQTGVGVGYSPVGANRREMRPDGTITLGRNPYGPTDKEVLVMKIVSNGGTPVGGIFDYATHATSLGPDNLMVSGDVLGISAQFVEKILGEDLIAPVFAGASGNIDPWYRILPDFNTEPGWIPETVLLGTLLGEEVVHVFRDIKETTRESNVSTSKEIIELPRKKKVEDDEITVNNQTETIPVTITAAKLGDDIAFIGFNVEMLTEIGLKIKSASPFKHTFIITHCNGYSGYLPPAELYKEGGYEVTSTPFEIGSAELVIKKALRMLYDLR